MKHLSILGVAVLGALSISPISKANAQSISDKTIGVIERAMNDEIDRAQTKLHLQGLVDPFFISYTVLDERVVNIQAANGALTLSNADHQRQENVRLLVNNYQFNDENFTDNSSFFSFGSAPDVSLPLDDDYTGIRRVLWLTTDNLFKSANENFTKKKAAFEHKQLAADVKDLPDFAHAKPAVVTEPPEDAIFDIPQLEMLARDLSSVFANYNDIQNSSVELTLSNGYEFIRSTEGTRMRKPVRYCEVKILANAQAAQDGSPLSISRTLSERDWKDMPDANALHTIVKELADQLTALRSAPTFDQDYTGPVLFEDDAATSFLSDNVIGRLAAQREDLLGNDYSAMFGGSKKASLQEKLNTRILPSSVSIVDKPEMKSSNGKSLLGYYLADDEGVEPVHDLTLVDNGILKTLYMTRTPTKELRDPNGHARAVESANVTIGEGVAAPGVVEISDAKSIALGEMKKQLFSRAKDDGYQFAYVVRKIQTGAPFQDESNFNVQELLEGNKSIVPTLLYKVYPDGREELVRGGEIGFPTVRDLRELITSNERSTQNLLLNAGAASPFGFNSSVPASVIGPVAVLCPELEVHKKKSSANPTQPVVARPD